jgi:DNA replication protein DnaC
VIDEIGYSQFDRFSDNLFFQLQLICARYEKGNIILTSNKGFGEWGELMGDTPLATAILDRLLYHAHVVNIRGGLSFRLKSRNNAGFVTPPQQLADEESKNLQGGQF